MHPVQENMDLAITRDREIVIAECSYVNKLLMSDNDIVLYISNCYESRELLDTHDINLIFIF